MEKENIQKAFPETGKEYINESDDHATIGLFGGMSLRDYFAAKAMQADLRERESLSLEKNFKYFAERAYKMADAMLEERNK